MIEKEITAPLHLSKNTSISLNIDNPHTYFGVPHHTTSSLELISQMNDCDYKEEIYYHNYSSRPITIINRNGLVVTVKEKVSIATRDVIIRKVISFNNFSLSSAVSAINRNTDLDDVELVELKKALYSLDRPDIRKASVMIDYRITADEIKEKGNTIYHYQSDLLLTYSQDFSHADHPHCARNLNINAFGHIHSYGDQKELNIKIRYVNHDRNAQPMYINILGKIHLIKPQKDSPVKNIQVRDGTGKYVNRIFNNYVQLFYNSASDPDIVNPVGVSHVKFTLEEAKLKLGLYDSYSEAINSKSSDSQRKEELLNLSHQLEKTKHENALTKAESETRLENIKKENNIIKQELDKETLRLKLKQVELDKQLLELENQKKLIEISKKQADEALAADSKKLEEQLRKLRAEHEHELNKEAQRIKEIREARQNNRKDIIDIVKFIPATIIGIGAIATLVVKLNKTKES